MCIAKCNDRYSTCKLNHPPAPDNWTPNRPEYKCTFGAKCKFKKDLNDTVYSADKTCMRNHEGPVKPLDATPTALSKPVNK